MAVDNVVSGTTITATWGNAVADAINALLTPSVLSAYRGSTQSIPNNTWTTVVYDTVLAEDDEAAALSLAVGTGIITVATAGWYQVGAGVLWADSAAGVRAIRLVQNTATRTMDGSGSIAANMGNSLSRLLKCAAGDTLKVEAHQTSGGALNLGGFTSTYFTAAFVRG